MLSLSKVWPTSGHSFLERPQTILRRTLLFLLRGRANCTGRSKIVAPLHQRFTCNCRITMKGNYRNGIHGKAFNFNYRRNIPPLSTVHVPRIVFPKRLPCYTENVESAIHITNLPFLIAIHLHLARKKYVYIHRLT